MSKDKGKKHEQTAASITAELPAQEPVTQEPSQAELMAQLKAALDKGDFKAVAAVSRKIDGMTKATEKAELEAKRAAVEAMQESVKAAIVEAITPLVDSGELDKADGIWFSYDFGEQPTVRLLKTQTKTRTGGGGTGKKFDISTEDMLAKHGQEDYKDGLTFKVAYDQNTDKNWRYAIRQKLLKLEGIIS